MDEHADEKRLTKGESEVTEVRDLLLRFASKHCKRRLGVDDPQLTSGFIKVNAEVLRYLGACGLIKVTNDDGGQLVEAERIDGN